MSVSSSTTSKLPSPRRIVVAADDVDAVIASMRAHGAELVGEVAQYEDLHRLGYLRRLDGIIVALAEQVG